MSTNGPWREPGLTEQDYGTGHLALAASLLTAGSVFLSGGDNCVFAERLAKSICGTLGQNYGQGQLATNNHYAHLV